MPLGRKSRYEEAGWNAMPVEEIEDPRRPNIGAIAGLRLQRESAVAIGRVVHERDTFSILIERKHRCALFSVGPRETCHLLLLPLRVEIDQVR
jgi:hypothetical protein